MFEFVSNNHRTEVQHEKEKEDPKLERIFEKSKIFVRRMEQLMLILGISVATHFIETHSDKVEIYFEDGKEMYKHPDEKTTHILNYVAGLDTLTYDERIELLKPEIKLYYEEQKVPIPSNFDSMNTEEFLKYFCNVDINIYKVSKTEDEIMKDFFVWVDSTVPKGFEYDSAMYKLVWETEEKCGAPNVRWTFGQDRKIKDNEGATHYNPISNTIFIHPRNFKAKDDPLTELIAEWPHAKQVKESYLETLIGGVEEGIRIAKDALTTKSLVASQQKEYEIVGSIEYNAHKIIEPQIQKKFKGFDRAN